MITIHEFCMTKTRVGELVVVREAGYVCETIWIDNEDLFTILPHYEKSAVKSDSWGTIRLPNEYGDRIEVPCHYVDI